MAGISPRAAAVGHPLGLQGVAGQLDLNRFGCMTKKQSDRFLPESWKPASDPQTNNGVIDTGGGLSEISARLRKFQRNLSLERFEGLDALC
jgi:hypothetical protein